MPIANREFQYGILDVTFSMVNEDSLPANNQVRLIQAGGVVSYRDVTSVSTTNIDSQIYGLDNNYQYQLNQTSLGCGTNEWPVDISISTLYTFSGLFYSIIPPTNDDTLRISFSSTGTPATEFDKQHHGLTAFYQAYLNGADLINLADISYYSDRDIAGLDERLTENIGTYQTNYDLYAQYLTKFRNYWNQELDSNYQTTIGQVYAELREVGLMGGTDADPYITTGDYFSQSCNKRCTEETLNALLTLKIQGPESDVYSREDCIQHVATVAAKLTEYWNIAHTAATTIGIFLPETWDCIAQLEDSTLPPIYRQQLPLLGAPVSDHWEAGAGPQINQDIVPVIEQQGMRQSRQFKFYNSNKMYEQPLALLADTQIGNTRYTNTNNYYQPLSVTETTADSRYWVLAQQQHHSSLDTTSAYYAYLSYKEPNYRLRAGERPTPANILRKWISGATIADRQKLNIDWTDMHYNPNISFLTWLAQSREYNDAKYYTLREEHDKLWHHLHEAYPGVFRESNYVNQDASTPLELYNASKRELEASCQPQFSYSLTGMDIYMHDSDYNPMQLQVTDQIRIDYQEDIHGADTLGKALREPLYVTGIRHNLRNDGDYQFDVTTRKGTDVMMQRFAQLLNFGN